MGKRGPKPSKHPGVSIGAHVDAETLAHLEDVTHTRQRTRSFIAAEAIRLGLPLVERSLPLVRASKRRASKATKKATKKAGATKRSATKKTARASK